MTSVKVRTALLVAILFGAMTTARSGEILVTSPDHARTFAYGEMTWHQLSLDPDTRTLLARITFSNLPYSGSPESRVDEPFDFRFPRTRADLATGKVFARDRHGNAIMVASFYGDLTNGWVELTPQAKIYLLKESGCVTAILTATSNPRPGMRWIQMDDNWSLQNLLLRGSVL